MRIGRSLSPGKVFFEKDGVLKRISISNLETICKRSKKSGYSRINGRLFQWGISDSDITVDVITFPVAFETLPYVQVSVQGGVAEIANVTTTGFHLITSIQSVNWTAFGR